MTFNAAIPAGSDNVSTSQGVLLSNNQFLANTTGNVVDPGFYKLPNGIIIQWGNFQITSNGNKSENYAVAFTTAVFSLQFSLAFDSAGAALAAGTNVCIDFSSTPLSKTAAKFRVANNPDAAHKPTLFWYAIGV